MNQTTILPSAALPPGTGFKLQGVGTALSVAWRWLVDEQQIVAESLFDDDFQDTQWQDTQWVSGQDVPIIRFRAV